MVLRGAPTIRGMRKFLALVFGLALFVPLAACGGGDDDESSSDGSSSSSASSADEDEDTTTTTEEEDGGGSGDSDDFCGVIENINDADFEDLDFEDPEAVAVALAALEELQDAAPNDDLADDLDELIAGFEFLAENFEDLSDPETAADLQTEFEDEFPDFDDAGERVDEFSLEECGITVDGETADDTESTAGTVSDGGSGDDDEDTSLDDFADDVDDCEGGDMEACDQLFAETPVGSEAETVGATCGGRSDERIPTQCDATFG
jgi:hypothetical protein